MTETQSLEPEKLSLRGLVGLLKPSAAVSLVGIIFGCAAMGFWLGQKYQYDATAICLERPFGMTINMDSATKQYAYGSLILTAKHHIPSNGGPARLALVLRQKNDFNLFDDIGEVIAQEPPIKKWRDLFLSIGIIGPAAYAQSANFDWGRYKGDDKFREEYVDGNKVRRYYDDGAVLEYRVDANGQSLLATLRWIKKPK